MAGTHRICVIPGDGVGAEVIPQALRVLDAAAACGFGLERHSTLEMGNAVLERLA
jgi:isocitrate/isopropylmalate dehydrogenase